jgi:hypothetical protein
MSTSQTGSTSTSLENSTTEPSRPARARQILWPVLNSFSCIFIIFPIVIVYWSGSWKLLDVYVFPDDEKVSSIVCTAAGSFLLLLAYFVLPLLKLVMLRYGQNTWMYVILSRLMIYLCGIIIIVLWHGWWGLQDLYFPDEFHYNIVLAVVPAAILIPLKSVSALVSTPFQCTSDLTTSIFDASPRFRTTVSITTSNLLIKETFQLEFRTFGP